MKRARKRYRRWPVRRVLVYSMVCLLFILAAVVLINLESPQDAAEQIGSGQVAPASPAAEPAPEAPAVAVPSPPLPVPPEAELEANAKSSPPLATGEVSESDLAYLRSKSLLIPVEGIRKDQLRDSFLDGRSEGRLHLALDIMAPEGTAVLAATDGKVLRLYESVRGGIMLYQQDPSGNYVYYYGHLSRYADGVHEGKQVRRGEVIAHVGDTGNAGEGNFHLHFGISRVDSPGRWSGGIPINPYPLLAGR